jgi:hypothetical protein
MMCREARSLAVLFNFGGVESTRNVGDDERWLELKCKTVPNSYYASSPNHDTNVAVLRYNNTERSFIPGAISHHGTVPRP